MQDPKNWKTLAFEFAKAIHKMGPQSLAFLSKFYIILQIYSVESLLM
jgi:hypothetical protein